MNRIIDLDFLPDKSQKVSEIKSKIKELQGEIYRENSVNEILKNEHLELKRKLRFCKDEKKAFPLRTGIDVKLEKCQKNLDKFEKSGKLAKIKKTEQYIQGLKDVRNQEKKKLENYVSIEIKEIDIKSL